MRIPIPLILAAAVVMGSIVTIYLNFKMIPPPAFDWRWESWNGTAVINTGTYPGNAYTYVYGGVGNAYFGSGVNVYYFYAHGAYSNPDTYGDFGRYVPFAIKVDGTPPTQTTITFTNPYNNGVYGIWFYDWPPTKGYVGGRYSTSSTTASEGVAVPVFFYQIGENTWIIRPAVRSEVWSTSEACNVAKSWAKSTTSPYVLSVPTQERYDCVYASWSSSTSVRFNQMYSGVTQAPLTPESGKPLYYTVKITGSGYTITVYLGYWWFVTANPGTVAIFPTG